MSDKKSFTHQFGSLFVVFGIASLVLSLVLDNSFLLLCGGFGIIALLVGFALRIVGG